MTPAALSQARTALGLTQGELASELGLSPDNGARTVRRWESQDQPIPGSVEIVLHYWLKDVEAGRVRWAFLAQA